MFIHIVFYRKYLVTCTSKTAATLTKTQTVIIEFPICLNTTSETCNSTSSNATMSTSNSTADNSTVDTCNITMNNTTSNTSECEKSTEHTVSIKFTDTDGLLPLTLYECVIQLTVNNYTSAKSVHTLLYTTIKSDGKLMCFWLLYTTIKSDSKFICFGYCIQL